MLCMARQNEPNFTHQRSQNDPCENHKTLSRLLIHASKTVRNTSVIFNRYRIQFVRVQPYEVFVNRPPHLKYLIFRMAVPSPLSHISQRATRCVVCSDRILFNMVGCFFIHGAHHFYHKNIISPSFQLLIGHLCNP